MLFSDHRNVFYVPVLVGSPSRWSNFAVSVPFHSVMAGFDEDDFPVDVIWLDIEHTTEKKYVWTHCELDVYYVIEFR